jgi:cation diffusion facilitator family transporter
MTSLLLKIFVKGDINSPKNREKCGFLGGIVGIICNLVLFIIKLIAGLISGSVSITADAFNNLSDMGSSVVTMLGFKIASKPADNEHPFGHGRMEYMAAAFVSVLIVIVGFELFGESAGKLKNPTAPDSSIIVLIILAVSIAVKLWMSFFNRKLGKKINSDALIATASDSLNDCISTGAVLIVCLISHFAGQYTFVKYLDPAVGILVSLFIMYSGFSSVKQTLDPLIGLAPEPETVDKIKNIVFANPDFLGIHDMIVHNYGPGRSFVSLHVEVPANIDILYCHEEIDRCERDIKEITGIEAVIHMDPIVTDDETVNFARKAMSDRLREFDPNMTLHDFRMVKGEKQNNLIFDVVVPQDCKLTTEQIKQSVSAMALDIDPTYRCVITVDADFSGGKHMG